MLERFVKKALIEHLEVNNILSTSQHGFRSGRSVDTNLIQTYELVTTLLDEGFPVDMILLDLSKAFDKVCFYFFHKYVLFVQYSLNYLKSQLGAI